MDFSREQKIYIMPRMFGPAGGPRQAPDHPDYKHGPTKFIRHLVRFRSRADQLAEMLPKGLSLRGEPIVQFQFYCLTEIPWLAGRGYNILSMLIPVRHTAADGNVTDGQYQAVLWENLGDPIITGREQLGHPKLYAQLPPPRVLNGTIHLQASWEGFKFADLSLTCKEEAGADLLAQLRDDAGAGTIGHKYIPRSGSWDEADADYLTLTPAIGISNLRDPQPPPSVRRGTGSIRFAVPEWQDMPTQYHVVRQLAALEQHEALDALVMEGSVYGDSFDQIILR